MGLFNLHVPNPKGSRLVSVLGPDPERSDGRTVVIEDSEEELAVGRSSVGKQRIRLFAGNPSGDIRLLPRSHSFFGVSLDVPFDEIREFLVCQRSQTCGHGPNLRPRTVAVRGDVVTADLALIVGFGVQPQ